MLRFTPPHACSLGACALALLALPAAAQQAPIAWFAFGENTADAGDLTGRSVAFLPDINGDGSDEVLIGAPNDEDGGTDAGTVYVVSGGYPFSVLFEIHGSAGDNCGQAVAHAGDLNDDGVADFIVGFPGDDVFTPPFNVKADAGRAIVYSGADGSVLRIVSGPVAGARLGEAVARGADTNGDGIEEILVGAPSWDDASGSNQGYAVLVDGATGAVLNTYTGTGSGDLLGAAVAFVGDLNGDQRADVAIGSPGDDYILGGPLPLLVTDGGRLDVYNGYSSLLLFSRQGGQFDELGTSVCGGFDTDGDGQLEVLVGAPGDAADMGIAHLYEGSSGTLVTSITGPTWTTNTRFGTWVARAGDVDKDGHEELAIGAPMGALSVYGGNVRLVRGSDYGVMFDFNGPYPGDNAGLAFAGGGDVNADGWPELLVSWPYSDAEGADSGLVIGYGMLDFQPDLGFVGPGSAELSMYGTPLSTGGQADIRLRFAPPNTPTWLLASPVQFFAGFKGGILVPAVNPSFLLPLTTDVNGQFVLPGIPGGGGYLIIYMQCLVKHPGFPQGWGLSNALAVELLP